LTLGMTPSLSNEDLTSLANLVDPAIPANQTLSPESKTESVKMEETKPNRESQSPIGRRGKYTPSAEKIEVVESDEAIPLPAVEATDPLATALLVERIRVVREQLLGMDGLAEERIEIGDPDLTIDRAIISFSLE